MAFFEHKPYDKVVSIDQAVSNFHATGISPIITKLFNDNDFYIVNTPAFNKVNSFVDDQDNNNRDSNLHSSPEHSNFMSKNVDETPLADPLLLKFRFS